MNVQELSRLVGVGEGIHLEFKRRVPRPERIAKEIIAFANTRGGRLILGVDDDGTIRGVRDVQEELYAFRLAIESHCQPEVALTVERIPVAHRRDIIIIHVPESASKPHFLVNGAPAERRVAYVRVDDMSMEASREAIRLMKKGKDNNDVLFEFGEKELMLMRYLEQYGRITVSEFARLANVNPDRASQTLVLMTRARVLQLHNDRQGDYFTMCRPV